MRCGINAMFIKVANMPATMFRWIDTMRVGRHVRVHSLNYTKGLVGGWRPTLPSDCHYIPTPTYPHLQLGCEAIGTFYPPSRYVCRRNDIAEISKPTCTLRESRGQ